MQSITKAKHTRFHSEHFLPSNHLPLNQWKRSTERKMPALSNTQRSIKDIEEIVFTSQDKQSVSVIFTQHYSSPGSNTLVRKKLNLVFEGANWKIVKELIL